MGCRSGVVYTHTTKRKANTSRVKKIVRCSFYCRPGSTSSAKSLLLDHICEVYQLLKVKCQKGLHFAIAGDANYVEVRCCSEARIGHNYRNIWGSNSIYLQKSEAQVKDLVSCKKK